MIRAMADRPDTVILAAVLKAAQEGPKPVRLAAIESLQQVGNDTCLATLMRIAMESDAELADSAKETLAGFPGRQVDHQIVARLPDADNTTQTLLLELVGRRRIDAVPDVMKALSHSDSGVRCAALTALGEIVSLDQISILLNEVVSPKHDQDTPVAIQALKAASVRMPDPETCSAELAAALAQSSTATKSALLEIISEVGGSKALQTLAEAAQSGDQQLLDTSSRLLGKWNSIDAAPVLLDLAKTGTDNKYRVRALRGYLGLARKFSDGKQRAQMCQNAIETAIRPNEQKLALEVLALRPSAAGLAVAVRAQQLPALKQDATNATLAIAQKLGERGGDVKQLMSTAGLQRVNLEIIKAEYGSGSNLKDVTKSLRKQASDVALITLESTSYNTSFGGDPTPGVVKQLKIEYRINGKVGTASFSENALILLPMPK
jgi:HEAT repeat protein